MAEIRTDRGGDLKVIDGDDPYLWIGGADNRCVGVVNGDELRALRDAITEVLGPDEPLEVRVARAMGTR